MTKAIAKEGRSRKKKFNFPVIWQTKNDCNPQVGILVNLNNTPINKWDNNPRCQTNYLRLGASGRTTSKYSGNKMD